MTLSEFKKYIDAAVERAGNAAEHVEVFISYKGKEYEIVSVSQFGVVPETYIQIGEKVWDEEEFKSRFEV